MAKCNVFSGFESGVGSEVFHRNLDETLLKGYIEELKEENVCGFTVTDGNMNVVKQWGIYAPTVRALKKGKYYVVGEEFNFSRLVNRKNCQALTVLGKEFKGSLSDDELVREAQGL